MVACRFRGRSAVIAALMLCGILVLRAPAQSAASKPDTNAPTTRQDLTQSIKDEEKANKQRAKANKAQRKALRAQQKADAASKKAGLPPQH